MPKQPKLEPVEYQRAPSPKKMPPRWDLAIDAGLALREQLYALREFMNFRQNASKFTQLTISQQIATNFLLRLRDILDTLVRLTGAYNNNAPVLSSYSEAAVRESLRVLSMIESDPQSLERLYQSLLSLTPPQQDITKKY